MIANIHQAKTNLSKLLAAVERGEEVVIARAGKPVARMVAVEPAASGDTRFAAGRGILKGKIRMSSDAEMAEADREIEALFNDGPLFPA